MSVMKTAKMSQEKLEELENDKLVNLWLHFVSLNVSHFALNEVYKSPILHGREKDEIKIMLRFIKSKINSGISGKGELGKIVKSQAFGNVGLLAETFASLAMMPPSEVDTLCEKIINLCQEVADKKKQKNDE